MMEQHLINQQLSCTFGFSIHLYEKLLKHVDKKSLLETDIAEECYEGAIQTVRVNRYERDVKARKKCINFWGCKCIVCGFDFEKKYGELGRDFIHVHHIKPLNTIGHQYKVDPQTDLIPVCPNCHTMLHRKVKGKTYTWEELRDFLNKQRKP